MANNFQTGAPAYKEITLGKDLLALGESFNKKAADKRAEDRLARQEAKTNAQEQAKKDANTALWNAVTKPRTWTQADYTTKQQELFDTVRNGLNAESNAARAFLLGEGTLDDAAKAYSSNLDWSKGLSAKAKEQKVAQFRSDLNEFRTDLEVDSGAGADSASSRINTLISNYYNPRFAELDKTIASGSGLLKEQKVDRILNEIPKDLRQYLDVTTVKSALNANTEGLSKADLLSAEAKRVETLNKQAEDYADRYNTYISRRIDANKEGKSYTSKSRDAALKDLLKHGTNVAKANIGHFDNKDIVAGYDALVKKGINPEIAEYALMSNIDRGIIDDSIYGPTDPGFETIFDKAKALQAQADAAVAGGTKSNIYIDKEAFFPKYTAAKDISELQRNLIKFSPAEQTRINPYAPTIEVLPNPKKISNTSAKDVVTFLVDEGLKADKVNSPSRRVNIGDAANLANAVAKRDREDLLRREALDRSTGKTGGTGGTNTMPRLIGGKQVTEDEYNSAMKDVGNLLVERPLNFINTGLNQIADYVLEPGRETLALAKKALSIPTAIKEYSENAYPTLDEIRARKNPMASTANASTAAMSDIDNAALDAEIARQHPTSKTITDDVGKEITVTPKLQKSLSKMSSSDLAAKEAADSIKLLSSPEKYRTIIEMLRTGNPVLANKIAILLRVDLSKPA